MPESFLEEHTCVGCGARYRELENMGRLCCRVHPGLVSLCVDDGRYYYDCCGRAAGTGETQGCLRCDHMEARVSRTSDTGVKHDELADWGLCVVPQALFRYGMLRPLNECIVHQDSGGGGNSKTVIKYRLPFDAVDRECDLKEQHDLLRQSVADVPLYTTLYAQGNARVSHLAMMDMINNGWKETLDKSKIGGDDADDDKRVGAISDLDRYIIPFVVIRRIAV